MIHYKVNQGKIISENHSIPIVECLYIIKLNNSQKLKISNQPKETQTDSQLNPPKVSTIFNNNQPMKSLIKMSII